jgi:diadenosine tetraphosphate (Ap4A) HIT family hydrolase
MSESPASVVNCPFCTDKIRERSVVKNELAFAVYDINPVSKGHMLIIPFRHVADFFETTREEQAAFLDLTRKLKPILEQRYHPTGYNFGVNIGRDAGQAVMHVHWHLIPRYPGDAHSRRSGMRHVISATPGRQETLSGFEA